MSMATADKGARESGALGTVVHTDRGFEIISFRDGYNNPCSLQTSSIALRPQPGTSAVWFGVEPQRMHLDRGQVAALIEHLRSWLDTGSLASSISLQAEMVTAYLSNSGMADELNSKLFFADPTPAIDDFLRRRQERRRVPTDQPAKQQPPENPQLCQHIWTLSKLIGIANLARQLTPPDFPFAQELDTVIEQACNLRETLKAGFDNSQPCEEHHP
jgi:hypothetical protein